MVAHGRPTSAWACRVSQRRTFRQSGTSWIGRWMTSSSMCGVCGAGLESPLLSAGGTLCHRTHAPSWELPCSETWISSQHLSSWCFCRKGFEDDRIEALLHKIEIQMKHQSVSFGLALTSVCIAQTPHFSFFVTFIISGSRKYRLLFTAPFI